MDQDVTGCLPSGAAQPDELGLAARLIREEFGDPEPPVLMEAAPAAAAPAPARAARSARRSAIHDEFRAPARPHRSRSHRVGMLAGLGVVAALLAALVLFAPGSGPPRLPVQSVHDVSPITASGPRMAAAIAAQPTTSSTTSPPTSLAPGPTTSATAPGRAESFPSTVTSVNRPASTIVVAPPSTAAPAPAPTTIAASPPPGATTTTTTAPPTTTTTHCLIGLLCG